MSILQGSYSTADACLQTNNLCYQVHIQRYGWASWTAVNQWTGSKGQSLRVEAIRIVASPRLGASIKYRTHLQGIGWTDWVTSGTVSGTTGQSRRLEAIEIQATGTTKQVFSGSAHIQGIGDKATIGSCGGVASFGTTGQSRRLEAIMLNVKAC